MLRRAKHTNAVDLVNMEDAAHELDVDLIRHSVRTLVDRAATTLGWSVANVCRLVETSPMQRSSEQTCAYDVIAGIAGHLMRRRMYTRKGVDGFYVTARAGQGGEGIFKSGVAAMAIHGYPSEVVAAVPAPAAQRFLGLGNVWSGHEGAGDQRVLDVGCGAGADLVVATMLLGPRAQVVGVDKRSDLFDIARAACPGAAFILGDIARFPLRDGSFDLVVANGLPPLQRSVSLTSTAASLYDLTNPGGVTTATIIIAAPAMETALIEAFPAECSSLTRGMATLISGKPTTHDVRSAFASCGASVSMSFGHNPYLDPELRKMTALLVVRAMRHG